MFVGGTEIELAEAKLIAEGERFVSSIVDNFSESRTFGGVAISACL